MLKSRKIIILIAGVVIVAAAAFFLPDILWRSYLAGLSGKPESIAYSMDISEKGLTQEKFAEIYVREGLSGYYTHQTEADNVLRSVIDLVNKLASYGDDKTQIIIADIINITNLVHYDENIKLINSGEGTSAVDLVSAYTETYGDGCRYNIGIMYEKKTQTITELIISINPDYIDGKQNYPDPYWMTGLIECADKYYGQMGLDDNSYTAYYDEYGTFTMNLLQGYEANESEKYGEDFYWY